MKSTGIIRRVDDMGRIILPVELRRLHRLGKGSSVKISLEQDSIVLSKHETSCVLCGGADLLTEFRGKNICRPCIEELREPYDDR